MNLFPSSENLYSMERKYSDALTSEDIHGYYIEIKKSKKVKTKTDESVNQTT